MLKLEILEGFKLLYRQAKNSKSFAKTRNLLLKLEIFEGFKLLHRLAPTQSHTHAITYTRSHAQHVVELVDSDEEAQDWGLDVFSRHGDEARDAYVAGFDNGNHACGCRRVGDTGSLCGEVGGRTNMPVLACDERWMDGSHASPKP